MLYNVSANNHLYLNRGGRGAVDYTVVNGKVTVKDGRICTIDEADLSAAAGRKIRQYLGK